MSTLSGMGREIRKMALLEAARAVCPQCADGRPLNDNGDHTAKKGGSILLPVGACTAWSIHQIIKRDEERNRRK